MGRYEGSLRIPGEAGSPLQVVLNLEAEALEIHGPGGVIGSWPLSEVAVRGEEDGFRLFIEGEEVILTTEDDGAFALEIGLHAAPPRLRRKMGAALHE